MVAFSRLKLPSWLGPGALVLAPVLLCALAVGFRLADLAGRDFWTDEAWVALAALQPTPAAALAAGQSAPPLFLLTLWALAKVWGGGEAVLRALPCLFGVGTVLLFWPLARALTPRPAALTALTALACSPVMVYFAKELKQYSGDAFFAVLSLVLAERLRARDGERGWLALGACGLLGLGFSHALAFTLPVVVAVLWFGLPSCRRRTAILGGFWALTFAVYYLLFFRHEVRPDLVSYWAQDFPDFTGAFPFLLWLGQAFSRYLGYFLGEWGPFWGLPLVLAGMAVLWRQGQGRALTYFLGPLVLALGAAAVHRYPFMAHYGGNRLMLFSAPLLYLLMAAGLAAAFTTLWRRRLAWLALGLTALLAVSLQPLEILRENLHPSINREEIRPLVAALAQQVKPGDQVYVYYHAISPFQYYYRGPLEGVRWGKSCIETDLKVAAPDGQFPRPLWLIASHILEVDSLRGFATGLLGPHWQETACLTRPGAALFRFEWQGPVLATKRPTARPGLAESGSSAPPADRVYK